MVDDVLIIELEGKIDSGNVKGVEAEILRIVTEQKAENLTLVCTSLVYMSSAGLRAMLRLQKQIPKFRMVEVPNDVYQIMELTGFTEIMEVRRSLRVISVEGCEQIGKGANGRVYRLDPETIVKVYPVTEKLMDIQKERELARTAFVMGIPTAIPYDVVRIEGEGFGAVYEMLETHSIADLVQHGRMTLEEAAQMSISLLKLIHSREAGPGALPDEKECMLDWVEFLRPYLPEAACDKLHRLIAEVPANRHLLHGDFYIKNVMLLNGEPMLIDMATLCCGNPIFELAFMYNAYRGFYEINPENIRSFLGITYEMGIDLWNRCLRLYTEETDEDILRQTERKAQLLGHVRIMRRSIRRLGMDTEEGRRMAEHSRDRILSLLDQVDSLAY